MAKVSCKTTIADDFTSLVVGLSEDGQAVAEFPVALADLSTGVINRAACFGLKTALQNAKAVSDVEMTGALAASLIGAKREAILAGEWNIARESTGDGLDTFGRVLRAVYEKLGKEWDEEAVNAKYYERGDDDKLTTECRKRRNAASRNATFVKVKQAMEAKRAKGAANVADDNDL